MSQKKATPLTLKQAWRLSIAEINRIDQRWSNSLEDLTCFGMDCSAEDRERLCDVIEMLIAARG